MAQCSPPTQENTVTVKHFSELQWPPKTLEEFNEIKKRTDGGRSIAPLFAQFLSELKSNGEGRGVWYDLEETDDSNAPE